MRMPYVLLPVGPIPVAPANRDYDAVEVTVGVDCRRVVAPGSPQEDAAGAVDHTVDERETRVLVRRVPVVRCYGPGSRRRRLQHTVLFIIEENASK